MPFTNDDAGMMEVGCAERGSASSAHKSNFNRVGVTGGVGIGVVDVTGAAPGKMGKKDIKGPPLARCWLRPR